MKILGIIPSRYASTRFPGKPLVEIQGKSMIQRVYEQAKKASSLSEVLVATDDERISKHVIDFGGKVILTSSSHQSGTDRCAEVINKINDAYDVVINIQGDEPFINPEQINQLCACFDYQNTQIATLIKKITADELFNINKPKVIKSVDDFAIYFSRNPIPFFRGVEKENWLKEHTYYKHIGIYGYTTETLKKITQLPLSLLEKAEGLEQLRWLENGYKIKVAETNLEANSVDTPEDLKNF
ncbi:MAG: 3-deoxy-manno-octulosonate cytidylyltransferase [Vicingaceae bacterium]|nr:3-deoxy-manno-octulosonate cytidylyltransferase [Vicingaceae bacterium]